MINLGSNLQEVFDKVCTHLDSMGHRAGTIIVSNGIFSCRYRAPNGDQCAIGCLIPDDKYDPDMEMKDLYQIGDRFKCSINMFGMLKYLQSAHDVTKDWTKIKNNLQNIANLYSLDTTLLNSLPFIPR